MGVTVTMKVRDGTYNIADGMACRMKRGKRRREYDTNFLKLDTVMNYLIL